MTSATSMRAVMTSITMRHERHEHHHARRRSLAYSHHIASHRPARTVSHHITSRRVARIAWRPHRTASLTSHRDATNARLVPAQLAQPYSYVYPAMYPLHVPPTSYLLPTVLPTSYSLLPTHASAIHMLPLFISCSTATPKPNALMYSIQYVCHTTYHGDPTHTSP